ncbi:CGNR zinc finger domain-containing protein [Sphingomonas pruni]|jgi:predicted RNA-binding Zn ribbon-like protein|uniref:CGNR zinc finger domain-containing protein n=1 Tax=Sphingomonas pruni TaxID=40683 RepID=UPI00082A0E6F|nr:CGNR zinc finger domain-containing protein [Sphingomonas pruni]
MAVSLPRPVSAIRLDGGRLAIDFANTIHDRFAVDVEDYIATPERYMQWARRSGAIAADETIDLSDLGGGGERLMADVRSLRDATYRLLSACIDEVPLPKGPLLVANQWLLGARQSQALDENGLLRLHADPVDFHLPLKRIALDLVDVLAGARAGIFKLKRCANRRSCGWIFADTSKNGRRRWCAMQTCGTASKTEARRNKR